mmetsp:Transcript_21945/g.39834  ORF Transcript_21945/g.39834 Transcript_21945/m.39834 type:complete len:116 (+) Transcript_21945:113-460(+)
MTAAAPNANKLEKWVPSIGNSVKTKKDIVIVIPCLESFSSLGRLFFSGADYRMSIVVAVYRLCELNRSLLTFVVPQPFLLEIPSPRASSPSCTGRLMVTSFSSLWLIICSILDEL